MSESTSSGKEEKYSSAGEEQVKILAAALAERFEESPQHDVQFRTAVAAASKQEPELRDAMAAVAATLRATEQELEEKCAATFSKLPRYTLLLQKIAGNLKVLASNAQKVKELATEVAQTCDVNITGVTGKSLTTKSLGAATAGAAAAAAAAAN